MMISLIWNKTNFKSELNETVFVDLKIKKLLESFFDSYTDVDEILEIMTCIPDSDTIKYRQEILSDILDDENLEFTKIYHKLANIVALYTNLKNANELIRRQVLFLIYLHNFHLFLTDVVNTLKSVNVKSYGLNNIINKINEFLLNKEYNKLFLDVSKIYNNIYPKLYFTATYKDGAPYVQLEFDRKETLEDKLLSIMEGFDIQQTKLPKAPSRKEVNLSFLKEIVLNNLDLFKPIKEIYEVYQNNEIFDLKEVYKELRFLLNIKQLFEHLQTKGIKLCKADIASDNVTEIKNGYDISLTLSNKNVIPNDFSLSDNKNIIFLLGVNSGGKTCYLRSSAISYLFFEITGYAFAESAKIAPVDYFYTHFPNEENYGVGEGRLRDEINRINEMKENFGANTICFCNETFSSTSEEKACNLTYDLLNNLLATNTKILFVTHQYQIFEKIHLDNVVYLAPEVDESNNNERTHKIKKVEKGLLSYADDILVKHHLSKKDLTERIARLKNE